MAEIVGDPAGDAAGRLEALLELECGEHAARQRGANQDRDEKRDDGAEGEKSQRGPRASQRLLHRLLDGDGPSRIRQRGPAGQYVPTLAVAQAARSRRPLCEGCGEGRFRHGFAAEHGGPHRSRSGGKEPSGAVERQRVSLLADADALHLSLKLEQIERRAHGAARLSRGDADVHGGRQLGDVRPGRDFGSAQGR